MSKIDEDINFTMDDVNLAWLAKQLYEQGGSNRHHAFTVTLSEHDYEIAQALGKGDPEKGIQQALRTVIKMQEINFEM